MNSVGDVMFKMFTAMSLVVVSAASALAFPSAVPAPAPEVAGGVLGMTFAAGLVYLLHKRRHGQS